MVILLFGQPASGKTTLAQAFIDDTTNVFCFGQSRFVHIDGDKWREISQNKDYSREGRIRNLSGAFDMALYLEKEGFIPVLSFVAPYREVRNYLKSRAEKLHMIYLTYTGERGRTSYFAKDFEHPTADESYMTLDTSVLTIKECVLKITAYVR